MEKKSSMSRVERLHREKVTRYSIRKYSFGAASVAVAALFMFLGNGAVSANELSKQETSLEATTPTLDKTQLESYISEIETKLSNGSYDNKTEESVTVLKADLEAAKATLANATTQAELKTAYNKLVTTANTKLKTKPVEKKETPAVDITEGKETVGKKAENTEPKSESNSIEHTGSNDPRNGKEMDKENAFRAETDTEKPTVEIPFANGKNVYVYSGEAEGFDIKIKDNSGFIKSATVLRGGNQDFAEVAGEPGKRNVQYGYTVNEITTKTEASESNPAVIHYTGLPGGELNADQLEKIRTTGLTLGWRYVTATDEAGNFIENRAVGSSNATDPGSFNVIAKPQTYKYDPVALETANKVVVADLAQLTETDLNNIKNGLKVEYSKTNDDAQLESKKGTLLDDAKTVVSSVAQSGSDLTVTYKDGSTDSIAVSSVARINQDPTVEFPYSDAAKREIYVYGAEENSFDIKIKDDADKIKSATLLQWGNKPFKPVEGTADKINTQYGYTANEFKTETPASDATPAVIRYSGTPKATDDLSEEKLKEATKGETPKGLALGWRYVAVTDVEGTKFAGSGKDAANDHAFRVVLKPQTQKYDVKDLTGSQRITVNDIDNITEDELGTIKSRLQLEYSKKNTDARLQGLAGTDVSTPSQLIKEVVVSPTDSTKLAVTYNDGSVDTIEKNKVLNVRPKGIIPFSNPAEKEIYVYKGEETNLEFGVTDDSGKIKDLRIVQAKGLVGASGAAQG
ncbi:YSIRK-type signal peptide-containing protein [Streptococcus sp. Marseille-Q7156]